MTTTIYKAYAKKHDPQTAWDAAHAVEHYLPELEWEVQRTIFEAGSEGLTSRQVAWTTGLDLQSVTPRMRPLVNKKIIVDSGLRRSFDGHKASIVWMHYKFIVGGMA